MHLERHKSASIPQKVVSQHRKNGNGLTTALLTHNVSQIIVVFGSLLSCKLLSAIKSFPHFMNCS